MSMGWGSYTRQMIVRLGDGCRDVEQGKRTSRRSSTTSIIRCERQTKSAPVVNGTAALLPSVTIVMNRSSVRPDTPERGLSSRGVLSVLSVSLPPGNGRVCIVSPLSVPPPLREGRRLLPRTIPTEVPYTSQWSEYPQTLHLARVHKQTPPSGTRYRAGQSSQRPRSPPQSPACRPFHLRIRMLGRSAAVPTRSIAYTPEEPDDALAALAIHASHTPRTTLEGRTWTTSSNLSDFRA